MELGSLRTDFVEYKYETLTLRFAPAYLLLYQPATTPSWVACIKHEKDNIGLVNDFVQLADVVPPLLFLRLDRSCRGRVGRGRQNIVGRC